MVGSISTPGIGSGLAIGDIVSALVGAQIVPKTSNIDRREAMIQSELSAIGLLQSSLSSFQDSLADIKKTSDFNARSVASSDDAVATVSILSGQPSTGSYKLEVSQLANEHKLISDAVVDADDIGTGTFTLTTFGADKLAASDGGDSGDGEIFSVDLATADADSSGILTLAELKDAINNAADNPGVTAAIINTDAGAQLVLTSNETGLKNGFEVTSNFTGLNINNTATAENTAIDAIIKVDGQTVTGSSNTFEDAIQGLSITAVTTNIGSPIDLKVNVSTTSIQKKIESFITAYNSIQQAFADQSQYDEQTTQTTPLFSSSLLRSLSSQIRNGVTGAVSSTTSDIQALASLGILSDNKGKLSVDSAKLTDAISDDYDGIVQLFTNSDGIATRLDTVLGNYLDSGGTFDLRTDSLNNRMRGLTSEREAVQLRAARLETRLLAQFNAMDSLVSQLNATSGWLASSLESLPGVVRKEEK